jgi:hypothetical protein
VGFALELNIENKLGVGWHQYSLLGYPASHSCLRLQEKTKLLYEWADEQLADSETVKVKGTPVVVLEVMILLHLNHGCN